MNLIVQGGTFTDVHYSFVDPQTGLRQDAILKLLSQDPANYADAPTEGVRRVLEIVTGRTFPRKEPLPTHHLGEEER